MYAGGHGATMREQQIYLLNSDKVTEAQFQLELKLRYLISDVDTLCKVFAIYDCCRVDLRDIKGLFAGRGCVNVSDDEDVEEDGKPCKYFHIQACGPGGIADADGGFAERIFTAA